MHFTMFADQQKKKERCAESGGNDAQSDFDRRMNNSRQQITGDDERRASECTGGKQRPVRRPDDKPNNVGYDESDEGDGTCHGNGASGHESTNRYDQTLAGLDLDTQRRSGFFALQKEIKVPPVAEAQNQGAHDNWRGYPNVDP